VPAKGAACTYNIIGDASICQIRFDFTVGAFSAPSTTGVCGGTQDSVKITSPQFTGTQLTPQGLLCGTLTGQHLYVESAKASPAATIQINAVLAAFTTRSWKIQVSMIECDNPGKAPAGCTQYFTGLSGTIQNYGKATGQHTSQQMLANQLYQVCIRREAGMCQNAMREALATSSFAVGVAATGVGIELDLASLPTDTTCALSQIRLGGKGYCGGAFLTDSTKSAKSAQTVSGVVEYGTGDASFDVTHFVPAAAVTNSWGYELSYQQIPC